MLMRAVVSMVLVLSGLATVARAQTPSSSDWPNWRGPHRDGTSSDAGLPADWPANGPKILWRAAVGKGFSSFAVADGKAFTMGNADDVDTVFCLNAESGKSLWKHSYPCPLTPLSYEGGPSATPAVDGQRVYTLSKAGHLFCLDTDKGTVVWSRKFDKAVRKDDDYPVDWGYASSPLVLGDKLFLSLGWAGTALNKNDGKPIWDNGPGRPGYASPVPFMQGDQPCLALFVARGVVAVEADSGKILWTIPWRTTWDQNAPDVLISDGRMFVSTGHGVGCALFDISSGTPKEMWRNKNLRSELASAVLWRGQLYGFDNNRLACLDWTTGDSRWSQTGLGRGSLILANGKLVVLAERGKLLLVHASPEKYEPLGEFPLDRAARYWTAPAVVGGRIFVRNSEGEVVCLDMRR